MSNNHERIRPQEHRHAKRIATALSVIAFTLSSCETPRYDTEQHPGSASTDTTARIELEIRGDSVTVELAEANKPPFNEEHIAAYGKGWTTKEQNDALHAQGAENRPAKIKVIATGTNESRPKGYTIGWPGDGYTTEHEQPREGLTNDHSDILATYLHAAETSDCIVAVLPTYNKPILSIHGPELVTELDKSRKDLRDNIVPAVEATGTRIVIADAQANIQNPDATTADGVHAGTGSALDARSASIEKAIAQCKD